MFQEISGKTFVFLIKRDSHEWHDFSPFLPALNADLMPTAVAAILSPHGKGLEDYRGANPVNTEPLNQSQEPLSPDFSSWKRR